MQVQMPMPHPPIQGATIQKTFPVPPVTTNPPQQWYGLDELRYIVDVIKRFDGATIQKTFPVPPVTTNPPIGYWLNREALRYIVEAIKRFDGATKLATFPVPPVSQPLNYSWDVNRYIWEGPEQQFDGAVKNQTFPVPPVSQPVMNYYLPFLNQYLDQIVKRFDGATKQQTHPVFKTNEPLNYSWDENWYLDKNPKRLENTPAQASPTPGVTTNPSSKYYVPDTNRYIWEGPEQQFDGATKQQTFVFFPNQPNFSYYTNPPFAFNNSMVAIMPPASAQAFRRMMMRIGI